MSKLAIAYAVKKRGKRECMAEGGEAAGIITDDMPKGVNRVLPRYDRERNHTTRGESHMGKSVRRGDMGGAKKVAINTLKEGRNIHPNIQGLAHGGDVEEASGYEPMPEEHDMENFDAHLEDEEMAHEDMVGRVMKKRMLSKGGMIANGGDDDLERMADGKSANFDDLALRDDLEFHYDGKNSGDELGEDVVSRAMRKRARG